MTKHHPIKVADGQIIEWHGTGDKLTVSLLDWQKKSLRLSFANVAAVLVMSPTSLDLSHLETSDDDPLILTARQSDDDESNTLLAFRFISAWDGKPVLTVVASMIDSEK